FNAFTVVNMGSMRRHCDCSPASHAAASDVLPKDNRATRCAAWVQLNTYNEIVRGNCAPATRPAGDGYFPFSSSTSVVPSAAGLGETRIPADFIASIFESAPPLPPEMMAPAWPMRRPGGAVTPAMKPTVGFLTLWF